MCTNDKTGLLNVNFDTKCSKTERTKKEKKGIQIQS